MSTVYESIAAGVQKQRAPNPGPMTLDGTNTWVLGDPAVVAPIIVDPGPLDQDHLERVLEIAGGQATAVWLTHRHHDHSDGAELMAELAGCQVSAADPDHATGSVLTEGRQENLAGLEVRVVATPGHTSDSVSFLVTATDEPTLLLTGDMVLGRGTTVITHPDGDLADYLESLQTMADLVAMQRVAEILPGHGDRISDPAAVLRFYREHRMERLDQVRAALAAGAETPRDVVRMVYAEVDSSVWPAAEQSVRAQLDYLDQR